MTAVQGRPVDGFDALYASDDPTENAGKFFFMDTPEGPSLVFACPDGCGDVTAVPVSSPDRASEAATSWTWDGNREAPTLTPSINRLDGCRWHGFLKAGVWESV